jgi:hypothetical protein
VALLSIYLAAPSEDLKSTILSLLASLDLSAGDTRTEAIRILAGGILEESELARVWPQFPESRAMANAFEAHRSQSKREGNHWKTAIAFEGDGRFLTLKSFLLARSSEDAQDWQGVIDACDKTMHPRSISDWGWASLLGPCLIKSGKAAERLQQVDVARKFYQRLLRVRSRAGADDAFVVSAQEGLARLATETNKGRQAN